jgi:RNA polymerase sigma-70 factor (ECF subfamily)
MASEASGTKLMGVGPALDDLEIVRRVKAGEGALFELLMRRYNQRLYRVARGIVKDDAEAEDVMQQAYVNAYTHLDQFADRAKFSTWLTRITVYEALGRLRRRGRLLEIDAMSDKGDPRAVLASRDLDPEQEAMTGELRLALERSLDSIPEIYRTAFVLREVEGLSTAETADCLDTSEDVVKTRLHRARALLRRELMARAGSEAGDAFRFHAVRCDRVVAAVFAQLGLAPAVVH